MVERVPRPESCLFTGPLSGGSLWLLTWASPVVSLPSESLNLDSSSIDFGAVNLRVACGERITGLAGWTEWIDDDLLLDNLPLSLAESVPPPPPCCERLIGVLLRRKISCSDKIGLLGRTEVPLSRDGEGLLVDVRGSAPSDGKRWCARYWLVPGERWGEGGERRVGGGEMGHDWSGLHVHVHKGREGLRKREGERGGGGVREKVNKSEQNVIHVHVPHRGQKRLQNTIILHQLHKHPIGTTFLWHKNNRLGDKSDKRNHCIWPLYHPLRVITTIRLQPYGLQWSLLLAQFVGPRCVIRTPSQHVTWQTTVITSSWAASRKGYSAHTFQSTSKQ